MKEHWSEILRKNGACPSAVRFASKHRTLKEAWDACLVDLWLTWLLQRVDGDTLLPDGMVDNALSVCSRYVGVRTCSACQERIQRLRSNPPQTWGDRLDSGLIWTLECAGTRAIRRIFPNPPRFRNGAGE